MRIAAVGDVHAGRANTRAQMAHLHEVGRDADVLVLAGDLTDHGDPAEAELLADELSRVKIPIVAVLGNHDFERGRPFAVVDALEHVGVRVLDGTSIVVHGVGIAGVKGFGGGFDPRQLRAFGERVLKDFVAEIDGEADKLAHALARLHTKTRVALLHYAPVTATLEGEPREIWAFMGSGKLEEAADRGGASVVVHGHAHSGAHRGETKGGAPVYNVAARVLGRMQPARPYVVIEVPDGDSAHADAGVP
jgi:Icc-related predicted phosphoesterase